MTLAEDANTLKLNETISGYIDEFQDKETRHIYADEFLNAKIATQIKVLREQRGWTQAELAERSGMKQARISLLEDVNYEAWTLSVLRRLAEAFDLRINVGFEDFGSYLKEFANFNRENLERASFEKDPVFKKENKSKGKVIETHRFPAKEPVKQAKSGHYSLFFLAEVPDLEVSDKESAATSDTEVDVSNSNTLAQVA